MISITTFMFKNMVVSLNYIKIIMVEGAAQNSSLILNRKTQVNTKLLQGDTLALRHKNSSKFGRLVIQMFLKVNQILHMRKSFSYVSEWSYCFTATQYFSVISGAQSSYETRYCIWSDVLTLWFVIIGCYKRNKSLIIKLTSTFMIKRITERLSGPNGASKYLFMTDVFTLKNN